MANIVFARVLYDGPWRSAKDAESSLIYKWAYIRRTREFLVRFWNSDALYVYAGVGLKTVNQFVDAPSRGAFFNKHIKEKCKCTRLPHYFRPLPRRESI
jgi:hypothetical protein